MVTAQWHPTPSAQRWSSVDLSAQRQLSVHLPAQKQSSVHLTTQRQLSSYSLDEVHDVLYCRSLGQDFLLGPLRVTLPTEVITVSICVIPITSSFTRWLALMVATVGPDSTANPSESGLETPSGS